MAESQPSEEVEQRERLIDPKHNDVSDSANPLPLSLR